MLLPARALLLSTTSGVDYSTCGSDRRPTRARPGAARHAGSIECRQPLLQPFRNDECGLSPRLASRSTAIRPASIADIPSIVKIRLRSVREEELIGFSIPNSNLYWSNNRLKEDWIKKNKLKDGIEVFVAEKKEQIVGFIFFNINNLDDNIDNIVVSKNERKKGIGRALVEYVEGLARSRGLDIITTDTTENINGIPWKAYDFWKKMGYKDNGIRLSTKYDFKVIPLVKEL